MENRSEILTLIAEIKGRLNELENLVQLGPNYAVPSPQAFEDPGVEDLTPRGYTQFRAMGLKENNGLAPLTPLSEFVQFAAPMEDLKCDIADFVLSDLHRKDSVPGYGLGSGFITRTRPQRLMRKRIGRLWGTGRIGSRPFASP